MMNPNFDGSQPCAQSGGESWFPENNAFTIENRMAIALCNSCRFKEPCLEYALFTKADGIWGGTTAIERRAIRRERGAA